MRGVALLLLAIFLAVPDRGIAEDIFDQYVKPQEISWWQETLNRSAWLRQKVGDDFEFVRGGKLPGLVGGEANTGGNRPDGTDGWSGRIMWSGDGTLFQYVYNPDQPGRYGEGFSWEMPVLEPGTWHLVETRIVMNTRGEADGVLQSWLDGQQVLDVDDMRFRFVDDFAIDALYFSTFFGGSGPSWAPVKDEYVYFDDFVIATEPITH